MKKCLFCQKKFESCRFGQKYCSHDCRNGGSGVTLIGFNRNRIGRTYEEIYGVEKALEIKKKISKATKKYSLKVGRVPPSRKGKKDSQLTRQRKSIGHVGVNTWTKEKWQNGELRPETVKKFLEAMFKRPTSLEKEMINLIKKYKLPYKYVGDSSFWIGRGNPDFINTEGKKILIEVGNVYHHRNNYKKKRKNYFLKYGWKSFIFIGNKLNEKLVLKTLGRFK